MQIQNEYVFPDHADQLLISEIHKMEDPDTDVSKFTFCYNSCKFVTKYSFFMINNCIASLNKNSTGSIIQKYKSDGKRTQFITKAYICFIHDSSAELYLKYINTTRKCEELVRMTKEILTSDLPINKYYLSLKQYDNEGNKIFN